jgi:hypothetical protein
MIRATVSGPTREALGTAARNIIRATPEYAAQGNSREWLRQESESLVEAWIEYAAQRVDDLDPLNVGPSTGSGER